MQPARGRYFIIPERKNHARILIHSMPKVGVCKGYGLLHEKQQEKRHCPCDHSEPCPDFLRKP